MEKIIPKNNACKKIFKHASNGLTHNLVLWIISKQTIHGYGIMKKLDEFLNVDDDFKNTSSKVYPLLRKMEHNGLISGEWQINENNKRVKYYSITDDGEEVLDFFRNKISKIQNNPSWIEFMEDMTGMVINNERN